MQTWYKVAPAPAPGDFFSGVQGLPGAGESAERGAAQRPFLPAGGASLKIINVLRRTMKTPLHCTKTNTKEIKTKTKGMDPVSSTG